MLKGELKTYACSGGKLSKRKMRKEIEAKVGSIKISYTKEVSCIRGTRSFNRNQSWHRKGTKKDIDQWTTQTKGP